MGASVAAASVLGTLLGLIARKGHGKMGLLVSYLWLRVTAIIAFFTRLLAGEVFRPRKEEESYHHDSSASVSTRPPVQPITEGGKPKAVEAGKEEKGAGEEREPHIFQFKFSFQIPEQSINGRGVSAGKDGESSMVTSISNYRLVSERDCRGFVDAPQATTLSVQESYIDSDGIVGSRPQVLDRDFKSRLSSVKHFQQADCNNNAAKDLDRELKNRLLSVKFSCQYDSDGRAAPHEEEQDSMGLYPYNLSRGDASEEELELLDGRLQGEADAPVSTWLFSAPAGDFGGFDSNTTCLESRSDGYSVKDLIVDLDSDGFFSERHFEAEINRARFSDLDGQREGCVAFEQRSKSTQLAGSLDFVGASEDFDGGRIELPKSKRNSYTEIQPKGLPSSISYLGLHNDAVSNGVIRTRTVGLVRELKSRFSFVKHSHYDNCDVRVVKELDRELKIGLMSVESSRRYDSDIRASVYEHKSLHRDHLRGADVSKELELLDVRLMDETDAPAGGQLFPVPARDSGRFNSDSESDSRSDGYSVKDLILDFNSDSLFPEEDVEGEVDKTSSLDFVGKEDNCVELEQKSKAAWLSSSIDSVGASNGLDGEDTGLLENMSNCIEIKRENLPNSINSSGIYDDVVAVRNLCAAELEPDQFHQEEIDQNRAFNDSSYTDEVSSITSHVGSDTEHMVKVHPRMMLSKGGEGGTDQIGVESRETKETQLSNYCGLDKECVDFGIENQNMRNSVLSCQVPSEEEPATSNSEPKHVSRVETGDVAEAAEYADELGQGLEDQQDSEETHLSDKSGELSMEEMQELESLWEHNDLIDQLSMDLRKARATGLPTILEESESMKSAEGLEPWNPEAQFRHEDPIEELHKFYKSYRERMRKFDVLNCQKMYAIGFLRLKDPLGTQKPITPRIASTLSQNLWRRKSSADPSEKFIKELQNDLEMVYVGQSCLSWEFLCYQYETTREVLGSDPHDGRQYNQVVEEFQQFQVLIQRFLENEPFQGLRVPNYAKDRCVLQRLLQVPVIREDSFKDKADAKRKRNDAITGDQVEYIMEDSIRIFWDFVKSDKDETSLLMKGLYGAHVELQDPTDADFMVDIQANLKQKQKRLKDILRTGNCLVRKFKKPQQGRSNQDDLFFSQVDLKLVSRVLKMTKITTDQLVWCHKKLSRISFVDRKLLREPSFLLFPC